MKTGTAEFRIKFICTSLVGLTVACVISACGGGGDNSAPAPSSATPQGTATIALTDAPGLEFDHVYVTVQDVWFHTSDAAGPHEAGWLKFPLPAPVTLDLAQLTNGALNNVFSNLTLPVGNYQQIRLFTAPTVGALTASAQALGLANNNQVVYNTNATAPLHIAGYEHGLNLIGSFAITQSTPMKIAVDFDLSHDVVKFLRGSTPEFILKPRLHYFDLNTAGAIIGKLNPSAFQSSTNPNGGYNLVIKAEELSKDGTYHVVTRATAVKPDGSFVLYPLPANKDGTARNYDVMIRGRNVETYLIKAVPVKGGTDPKTSPTTLTSTPINLALGNEYGANLQPALNPTGGWVNFYQTLPINGEVPYEIRVRHTNPFTGVFTNAEALSNGNLHWATYNNGQDVTFASGAAKEGAGSFGAVADAPYFSRAAAVTVAPPSTPGTTVLFNPGTLPPAKGVAADSISGNFVVPTKFQGFGLDTAYVLVVRNGAIVDVVNVSSQVKANGGQYSIGNIPGGTASTPLKGAFYTLYAVAWNSAKPASGAVHGTASSIADLRSGNATNITVTLK